MVHAQLGSEQGAWGPAGEEGSDAAGKKFPVSALTYESRAILPVIPLASMAPR